MNADCREGYICALLEAAKQDERIVALEADTGKGTLSKRFGDIYPDRYFEMGIAEQNMVSVATGLAVEGLIPFVNAFSIFASGRVWDQLRQGPASMKLNVKVIGTGGGLSDYNDGSSHQMLEDFAIVRVIPNICLLVPCDAIEMKWAVETALKHDGPVYIRSSRNEIQIINDENTPYDLMKVNVRRNGSDAVIFANGVMVAKSIEAAEILEKGGVSTAVVNIPCMKPLDVEGIIAASVGKKVICVAEEHSVIGGLGSCIVEALRKTPHGPIEFVGTNDVFGETAQDYETLLQAYGLSVDSICEAVRSNIGKFLQ